MARLASLAVSGIAGQIFAAVKNILIQSKNVVIVQTQPDYVHVTYNRINEQQPQDLMTLTTEANVVLELNVANTTNNIVVIPLTFKTLDGTLVGVKEVEVANIVQVEELTSDVTDSLVTIRDNNYSSTTGRVEETMAAIKALANA